MVVWRSRWFMGHAPGVHFESQAVARFFSLVLIAAASGSACRPETPPPPVVPVKPMEPQAASPDSIQLPPPPKEAPRETPDSPATAPSLVPDKPVSPEAPPGKPSADGALQPGPAIAPGAAAKKVPAGVREIHPNPGNTGCLEMYGTCTAPPDQLCTTSAFYLDCNAKGQLPSTGEWLHCRCP
jgi:hypothetical protein